jgi:hypothetical protein
VTIDYRIGSMTLSLSLGYYGEEMWHPLSWQHHSSPGARAVGLDMGRLWLTAWAFRPAEVPVG